METIRSGIFATNGDVAFTLPKEELEKFINSDKLGLLSLKCKSILPSYTLLHYCEELMQTFIKMQSLLNFVDIINEYKVPLENFYIRTQSKELLPYEELNSSEISTLSFDKANETSFICLIFDNECNKEFFEQFKKTQRPDIYVKLQDCLYPLYDFKQKKSVHLKSLSINSPGIMTFIGALGTIVSIYCNIQKEHRDDILSQSQLSGNLLQNTERISNLYKQLNDPNTPEQMKTYIRSILNPVMAKQSQIINNLGINQISIDEIV
ncbi:MAG: hypothetical protein J6J00_04105 [Treponema sp.]|nr:hypothetical protein [Treponema sp.]